jgi:hypothetical protein
MIHPTVFAFPTAEGSRFLPGLGRDTGEVLSRLTPQSAGATLTSFVKVTWMGRYRLLRRRALLMTGIVSSGIQGEVHRGAYSIWTALKIVSCTYSPGSPLLGREEAATHLAGLFDDLQREINQVHLCHPFHDAFMTSCSRI